MLADKLNSVTLVKTIVQAKTISVGENEKQYQKKKEKSIKSQLHSALSLKFLYVSFCHL